MEVDTKLNPASTIRAKIFGNGRASKYFTKRCADYMDKYVPYGDSGLLRTNITLADDSVTYNMPYAHYMYKGELYVDPDTGSSYARKNVAKVPSGKLLKYHTPGTGSRWDNRMWTAEGPDVINETQSYIDRGCK